jgi:hypothetical protein
MRDPIVDAVRTKLFGSIESYDKFVRSILGSMIIGGVPNA